MGGNATKNYVDRHSSGGGGGGGTTNYNELENKPSINGVVLSGNKTSEDLQIGGGDVSYTPNSAIKIGKYGNKDLYRIYVDISAGTSSSYTLATLPFNTNVNGSELVNISLFAQNQVSSRDYVFIPIIQCRLMVQWDATNKLTISDLKGGGFFNGDTENNLNRIFGFIDIAH